MLALFAPSRTRAPSARLRSSIFDSRSSTSPPPTHRPFRHPHPQFPNPRKYKSPPLMPPRHRPTPHAPPPPSAASTESLISPLLLNSDGAGNTSSNHGMFMDTHLSDPLCLSTDPASIPSTPPPSSNRTYVSIPCFS